MVVLFFRQLSNYLKEIFSGSDQLPLPQVVASAAALDEGPQARMDSRQHILPSNDHEDETNVEDEKEWI